ncbi:MAG: sigma-70 family RNA polymerase sigma factor [Deltaproteobacteria bacterium]|nr:MAG: sigma-70 family RNA polymerase sigma factor [Deltaproteobacteria bacterium]
MENTRRLSCENTGTTEQSSPLLTDEELVTRAQENDEWASEELVKRYQRKAYALVYHMCAGSSDETHDLTQEAFLRAFRKLKEFRGECSFSTWFHRVLVNTCLDERRRRRRWKRVFSFWQSAKKKEGREREIDEWYPDREERTNPMTVLSGKQLSETVEAALNSLPERQRAVFQLKVLHGMSIREIAEVMQAAEGTVKSHLFRATRFLREALKEWTEP